MYKFVKFLFFVFYLLICNISTAEETRILDDATPAESTFESDFTDEPEVTITQEGGKTLEEYRVNGQLYMVKVNPDGAAPYYLYKETLGGSWVIFGSVEEPLIVPQWVVFEF